MMTCPYKDGCPHGDYGGDEICNDENFSLCPGYGVMERMESFNSEKYLPMRQKIFNRVL